MRTIWKYDTPFKQLFKLELREGYEILTIQQDQKTNIPTLWVMVDTDNNIVEKTFELILTGKPIDSTINRKYINTYQYQGGEFIAHLFEIL